MVKEFLFFRTGVLMGCRGGVCVGYVRQVGGLLALLIGYGLSGCGPAAPPDDPMPDALQRYWSWVASIPRDGTASALASGLALLDEQPGLRPLYLRLVDVCASEHAEEACAEAFARAVPPDTLTSLYRDAARLQLAETGDTAAVGASWRRLAGHPALDPVLARLIVDRGTANGGQPWMPAVEETWHRRLARDSSGVGAAFGLGYAAVLRYAWDDAERLLLRASHLAEDDPQVYRELGRIYYTRGELERLETVLRAGIRAARTRHDLDQELTLEGNLGWILLRRDGDVAQAESSFVRALAQSRRLARESSEGLYLYRLAHVYLRQRRYDEALSALTAAEPLYARYRPDRRAEVHALRGIVQSRMSRYDAAEATLQQAVAEAEANGQVDVQTQALVALAEVGYAEGRYADARDIGLQALALARQNALNEHAMTALIVLGDVERRWGNYEMAATHFEDGLARAEADRNGARLRQFAFRLGLVALDLQDADTARRYFERLRESAEADGSAEVAEAYLGLGRAYRQYGNTQEALRYYDLALARTASPDRRREHAEALLAKAWALIDARAIEEAAALFEEARRAAVDDVSLAYRVAIGEGEVALHQARDADALDAFRRAVALERTSPRPSLHWYVLFRQAQVHWRRNEHADAEAAFRAALAIIETLRENLDSSENRSVFVQNKSAVYDNFAAFLDEQGRMAEALTYAERARSRSLVDLLYSSLQAERVDTTRATGRLIALERRVRALAGDLAAAEGEAGGADARTRVEQLRQAYAQADRLYRREQDALAPGEAIYTFRPLLPAAMQALLEADEALVYYDLRTVGLPGDREEQAAAYVVLQDTILTTRLAVQEDALVPTVRYFLDQIAPSAAAAGDAWEPAARRLYRDLVAPLVGALPASVRHLHIVPEGILHYLPFGTLLDADGRFLAERYTLSVAPSASILKLTRDRNPGRWRSMLLFGDPDGTLPGSRAEVLAIAADGPDRRALTGAAVTQAAVEDEAGRYDVLHFATHGRFVPRIPGRSHLVLHGEDVLRVDQIGRLQLHAYLVTLSACESALGSGLQADVPDGDEWVGFSQAFLAAGTPTVMATLWPIDDRVSSAFMVQFYEALETADKARALAAVQRRFLQDPRTRHPRYWAPFVLVGDPL